MRPPLLGMHKTLAFLGNRYGSLSKLFFYGISEAVKELQFPVRLVLVDTSTAKQASIQTRLRNKGYRLSKKVLRVGVETEVLDWFKEPSAKSCRRITPAGHRLSSQSLADECKKLGAEAALVAGCDQILKEPLLSAIPRIINFHNSLLPAYRGCNAVEWAFLNREAVSGYTFHTIESEAVDVGTIVFQKAQAIEPEDTPSSYGRRIVTDAAANLDKVVNVALGQTWPPAGVSLSSDSYYSAKRMLAIRAFNPGLPVSETLHRWKVLGSLTVSRSKIRARLTSLKYAEGCPTPPPPDGMPGTWARCDGGIVVRCLDGNVCIESINYLPSRFFEWSLPDVITP